MKNLTAVFRRVLPAVVAAALPWSSAGAEAPKFRIFSPGNAFHTPIPEKYHANAFGCSGGNVSPPLAWSGAPAGTRSFVITMFDPDERSTPSGWWHWVVYDIPATATEIKEGAGVEDSTQLPTGSKQGRTDLGNLAFHGSCPAKGDKPHHYTITLYALKTEHLDVKPGAPAAMVVSTAQDSLLAKTQLIARFGR